MGSIIMWVLGVMWKFDGSRNSLGSIVLDPDLVWLHINASPVRCHLITFSSRLRSSAAAIHFQGPIVSKT